ncbi:MAG: hypothetical protein Q4G34_07410 [Micrococcus sp.]|nr:hypothetical protein [Micrococcus sp.]
MNATEHPADTSAHPTASHPTGSEATPPSAWGRSRRLGGGTARLLLVSSALGLVAAAALWGITVVLATANGHPHPALLATLVAAGMVGTLSGVAWVFLVDADSLPGALRRPEDSVESGWLTRAQAGAHGSLLMVLGVGTFLVAVTGWRPDLTLVGVGLTIFTALDTTVRYLILKKRG